MQRAQATQVELTNLPARTLRTNNPRLGCGDVTLYSWREKQFSWKLCLIAREKHYFLK